MNPTIAEIVARQGEIMQRNAELQRDYRERRVAKRRASNHAAIPRFRSAHPERWDAIQSRRADKHRAEVAASRAGIDKADLRAMDATLQQWKSAPDWSCHYCGQCVPLAQRTSDHVIPLSRGGKHTPGNVVRACRQCNSRKNARTLWCTSRSPCTH